MEASITGTHDALLLITDISGYTNYLLNETELTHAQANISALLQSTVEAIKIPLTINKFEGDAILMYALRDSSRWDEDKVLIADNLALLIEKFEERLAELIKETACACTACANINALSLKMMVHSGTVLFYTLGTFHELSGVDAIIVHRLLKNSVVGERYILMSRAAAEVLPELPYPSIVGSENYAGIGDIETKTYYPKGLPAQA